MKGGSAMESPFSAFIDYPRARSSPAWEGAKGIASPMWECRFGRILRDLQLLDRSMKSIHQLVAYRPTASLLIIILGAVIASGCRSFKPPAPDWEWGTSASSGRELAAGEAIWSDRSGDLYVAGTTTGSVVFGGDTIRTRGSFMSYILRFRGDRPENVQVVVRIENVTNAATEPRRIRVDREGNIYLAGLFKGVVDFGGDTLTYKGNEWKNFVAKYRNDGTLIWVRKIVDESYSILDAFDITAAGDVYFSVETKGMTTIGDTSINAQGRTILVRMRPNGAIDWIRPLTNGRYIGVEALAVEPEGGVVVSGSTAAPLDLDGDSPAWKEKLPLEGFLAAYSPEGSRKWAVDLDRFLMGSDSRLCVTANAIYLYELVDNNLAIPGRRPSIGTRELTMACYDRDGAHRWSRVVASSSGPGLFYGKGLGIDEHGHLYALTEFTGRALVGDSLVVAAAPDRRDLVVTSHDTRTGELRWVRRGGGTGDEVALAMTTSMKGDVYITGWYSAKSEYGAIVFPPSTSDNFFLVKLGREREIDH
jgi:hypothetical protein